MNVQLMCDELGIKKRLLSQEDGRELNQAMVGINLVACFEVTLIGANNVFF